MNATHLNALRVSLAADLDLRKSRLDSFCVLVLGMMASRTVNLSHLAAMFPGHASIASNYRRLQRFFEKVRLDPEAVARLLVRLAGLGAGPWTVVLDRTNWKLGRSHVNILTLAVIWQGVAFPLLWSVTARSGNSTQDQRQALLARFCKLFGRGAIADLVADREFCGAGWMTMLARQGVPFILRIKQNFHVRLSDGRRATVFSLFDHLAKGGRCCLEEEVILGQRKKHRGPPVRLVALRLNTGELLVVATNADPGTALAIYRQRWSIECLFAACKTRGFNLEDTHLVDPDRIATLIAVLASAFAIAFATGQWRVKTRPIPLKAHARKAQSVFRYGLDLLRKILLDPTHQSQARKTFPSPHYLPIPTLTLHHQRSST